MQTEHGTICRIGVFYDGSFFAYAQRHYYHERELGWLRFQPLHAFIEAFVEQKEPGFASYKVVYAAWHQGLFTSAKATPDQLRTDRNLYHDLMHAGVEPRYLPMSDTAGEKGTDVALAVLTRVGRQIDTPRYAGRPQLNRDPFRRPVRGVYAEFQDMLRNSSRSRGRSPWVCADTSSLLVAILDRW